MSDDMPTVEKPAESAQPAPAGKPSALPEDEITRLNDEIVIALKTVYDPEIPADIYEIGLIYRIDIADDHTVKVDMSLTSPNCPSAQELPVMVQNAVSTVPGVGKVDVSVVWDPPWDPSRMSKKRALSSTCCELPFIPKPPHCGGPVTIRNWLGEHDGHSPAETPDDAAYGCRRKPHQIRDGQRRPSDRRRARRG